MNNREKCTFAEYIDDMTYIITIRASLSAKLSCEELVKKRIIKEAMQLSED